MSKAEVEAWEDQAPDTKRSPGVGEYGPSSEESWDKAALRVLESIIGAAS